MNENEKMVYSAMGLDPILLLEESAITENYMINIITPGEEEEVKNKKDITHLQNKNPIEEDSSKTEGQENIKHIESYVDLDEDIKELNPSETKEADEDPRRKRRRSSASS